MEKSNVYVSDVFDPAKLRRDKFNLVVSGCGTGKTHLIAERLFEVMPELRPQEVLLVASRAMIVQQQSVRDGVTRFTKEDLRMVNTWTEDDGHITQGEIAQKNLRKMAESGIYVMTYDRFIHIIRDCNVPGGDMMKNIKVIVFDECHALFADSFINDIEAMKIWIQLHITYIKDKYIIGMTATPDIIYRNSMSWGTPISEVLQEPVYRHKANHLVVSSYEDAVQMLVQGNFQGKALVLCRSAKDCFSLQEIVPRSAVIISANNPKCDDEILRLRQYICENETLPDTYCCGISENGEKRFDILNVLLATSTAREGFNLREESGVKTVISFFHDPINVIQICGRARYNLDTVVIADAPERYNKGVGNEYQRGYTQLFREFVRDGNQAWLNAVSPALSVNAITEALGNQKKNNQEAFFSWLQKRWVIPFGCESIPKEYRILSTEDQDEIVDRMMSAGIETKKSFTSAMNTLKRYGYITGSKTFKYGGNVVRGRFILEPAPSFSPEMDPPDKSAMKKLEQIADYFHFGSQHVVDVMLSMVDEGYSVASVCYAVWRRRERIKKAGPVYFPKSVRSAVRACAIKSTKGKGVKTE